MDQQPTHDQSRLQRIINGLDHSNRILEPLASGGGCDLVDEKVFEGEGTTLGELCRIKARASYLLDVLACEVLPSPNCCTEAAEAYCDAFDSCPA